MNSKVFSRAVVAGLFFLCSTNLFAQKDSAAENTDRPIQALLVTGGCCHDYDRQKLILTRGISARANVRWTVVQQGGKTTNTKIPLYNDPNWADGFDIVVHNECFAHVKDKEFVDRILAPHRNGTPAILIHCAMHCYRTGDDRWFEFVGMQSPGHGPHYSYKAENVQPDHPIMAGFGDRFVAPKGELYHSMKVFPTATPLAQANRKADGMPQVCVWTNNYRGTRVFGTTIGHYNETMVEPQYMDMLTKGLLWAVGRDPKQHFSPANAKANSELAKLVNIPVNSSKPANQLAQNCCGPGNVAYKKSVKAKSIQKPNFEKNLTDGLLDTRYCASSGSQRDEWVVVDLGEKHHLRNLRLHWEKRTGTVYRYTIEASPDNKQWKQIADASKTKTANGIAVHKVDSPDTQFLRINWLGANRGLWFSLWELEATEADLPELPKQTGPTASFDDVKTPAGFNVSLFGAPPEVTYPVCLTAAVTGEVFVGVDEQGSLGKDPDGGRVLRCIDTDGDGQADKINVFAEMDHPRGLVYDAGSLWVLHPPYLTVFHDTDLDGTSDRSEVLIEGISTNEVNRRGADHTTNGIRMGIDGWIYIAVGDFGFTDAVGKDGTRLAKRGGGIVRIRPDGTEMEIFAWGLRNILDVSIDPLMNVFTRDNTNDGGGWDIRVSHILQSANYGYPSLYKNFSSEIMPPLADYGGGSGCGTMYFHDMRWPEKYRDSLLTCDWGRSEVYSHNLPQHAATYEPQQDVFLKLPRPTDIDVDGSGRMYVSSWKNGKFSFSGPNVGFVAQITPQGFVPHPVPEFSTLNNTQLISNLSHDSAAWRLHSQREILRRAKKNSQDAAKFAGALNAFAGDDSQPMFGRVAAIFTLKQMLNGRANGLLSQLAKNDKSVEEYCIKAIADRRSGMDNIPLDMLQDGLGSDNPRTRAAALIAVGRLADKATPDIVQQVLSLTQRTESPVEMDTDDWRKPDPGRVIPHLAVHTLARLDCLDVCLRAIETAGPFSSGALLTLKQMHQPKVVDGLFQLLSRVTRAQTRAEIWTTLIRLYYREGEYKGGWWGTRPDTTGPYFDRQPWSETKRIEAAIRVALSSADDTMKKHLQNQLRRHVVKLDGSAPKMQTNEPQKAIEVVKADPNNPDQIANLDYSDVLKRAMASKGDAKRGEELFRSQSCIACHTYANGMQPKGPHLVDIGKRYKRAELIESIVKPNAKIAQGFDTWAFVMDSGKVETGFVVLESAETITIRTIKGLSREIKQDDIDERVKQKTSMMPKGIADALTPEALSDLLAYLESLH